MDRRFAPPLPRHGGSGPFLLTAMRGFWRCMEAYWPVEEVAGRPRPCAFRGMARAHGDGRCSLQRALERLGRLRPGMGGGTRAAVVRAHERWLLREFQRHAHRLLDQPLPQDEIEWLSLMQHHGAPTRLLDWSYSFAIAVFFAVQHAVGGDGPDGWPQVWAVDIVAAAEASAGRARTTVANDPVALRLLHRRRLAPAVYPANSLRLNERLAVQQGLFTMLDDPSRHLADNLRGIPHHRIAIAPALRHELLLALLRMNITQASLFPGLDGFARSLAQRMLVADVASEAGPAVRRRSR